MSRVRHNFPRPPVPIESLHGSLLHAAGARNAVDEAVSGSPELPLERLIALDPDVIVVLSASPLDAAAEARTRSAFDALTPLAAVRHGRVRVIAGPEVLRTGPSVLELVPRLAAEISASGAL